MKEESTFVTIESRFVRGMEINMNRFIYIFIIICALILGVVGFWLIAGSKFKEVTFMEGNSTADNEELIAESNLSKTGQEESEVVINVGSKDDINKASQDADMKDEYVELDIDFEVADLYTDPILMNPSEDGVYVVWFCEEAGSDNAVLLYELGNDYKPTKKIEADTIKLSRIRGGKAEADCDDPSVKRDIFRHEAFVELDSNQREVPYRVVSDGRASDIYALSALPKEGEGIKVLLTSDLQLKNMGAANIQKVYETVGKVDAVFANGDIVDVPDRAYDWFDADNALFKVLQGRADHEIGGVVYKGAKILQNAPIYASVGNHDVMGVYSDTNPLSFQFNNPTTREFAKSKLSDGATEEEIEDNSFNTRTWEEIFNFPESDSGDERYYAFTIADVRVIVLEVARIWRLPTVGILSKYSELPDASKKDYGFGQFIFEPVSKGSQQYEFLIDEINSDEFKNAKYKMVMYHFDSHSLGGNSIPPFTDPVAKTVSIPGSNQKMVIYDYPKDKDYLLNDIEPIIESNGVNLLFNAHSHLWNRFVTNGGMNILQTSNVGNTYNAFVDEERELAPSAFSSSDIFNCIGNEWDKSNYTFSGDPGELEPQMPNIRNLPEDKPYLASNTVTAFSILDTNKGTVDSYYFDTEDPDSEVVMFDSFKIKMD